MLKGGSIVIIDDLMCLNPAGTQVLRVRGNDTGNYPGSINVFMAGLPQEPIDKRYP